MDSQDVHQETENDWGPFGLPSTVRHVDELKSNRSGRTELMAEGQPRVKVEPSKKPEEDFLRGHLCLITEND